MHYALHAPLLLDLHGNHEALAADSDQFFLQSAAFGEIAADTGSTIAYRPPLLLDLATNAREVRRGVIFERAVRVDLVTERPQQVGEVGEPASRAGQLPATRSWRLLVRRIAFGGLRRTAFHSSARSATSRISRICVGSSAAPSIRAWLELLARIKQTRQIRNARPASQEFANLGSHLLLIFNPLEIGDGLQCRSRVPAPAAKKHSREPDRATHRIPALARWCVREEPCLYGSARL